MQLCALEQTGASTSYSLMNMQSCTGEKQPRSRVLQIFYKTYQIFFFTLHTVYCMRTFCDTFAPFLKLECGRCSLPYECKQDIFLVQPWTSLPNQNWQAGPPSIVLWPQARLSANR